MKKIAILSAVNIKHMSLISLYTDILKQYDVCYDIIYMDKYGEDEFYECHQKFRFVNLISPKWCSYVKMYRYMKFYPYATKVLKENKYDFVIVWNDLAIFMFADFLRKNYNGKYCLNVRDNMYYDKKLFRKRYEKTFNHSAFNTISSKGYLDFLPSQCSYLPINSLNLSVLKDMKVHTRLRTKEEPIRIGFIGYVRFFERNKKMLDVFKNDNRFELHYYGSRANVLKEYAEDTGVHNAVFHDSFPVAETGKFLEKIDIINNLYGNGTLNIQKAISIKIFHALYSKVPILVNSGTYIGNLAINLGIGYYFDDISECSKNKLYDWYYSLDFNTLKKSADDYLALAMSENAAFKAIVMGKIIND